MLFALLCKDKPGHLNVRVETRPTHVEYLTRLNDEGTLAMAGPFLDDDGKACGSLVIVKAETAEEAKAIGAADPYAKAGLFESVDVKAFNWVFNKPEA